MGAVRFLHVMNNSENPTTTAEVKLAYRRVMRKNRRQPKRAAPITPDLLERLLETCGDDLEGLRDRALMLARGVSLTDVLLDLLGKSGSTSGGRRMPGFANNRELRLLSAPTGVGTSALQACGLGQPLDGTRRVRSWFAPTDMTTNATKEKRKAFILCGLRLGCFCL